MIPCMGGWCSSREGCRHYYAESTLTPSERLCGDVEETYFVGSGFAARPEVGGMGDQQMHVGGTVEIRPVEWNGDSRGV